MAHVVRRRAGIVDGRRSSAAGVYYCSNYRVAMSALIVALVHTYHLAARRISRGMKIADEISIREARTGGDELCARPQRHEPLLPLEFAWLSGREFRTFNAKRVRANEHNRTPRVIHSTRAPSIWPFPVKENTDTPILHI